MSRTVAYCVHIFTTVLWIYCGRVTNGLNIDCVLNDTESKE